MFFDDEDGDNASLSVFDLEAAVVVVVDCLGDGSLCERGRLKAMVLKRDKHEKKRINEGGKKEYIF